MQGWGYIPQMNPRRESIRSSRLPGLLWWEELRHFHGQHHIAIHFQLASHEGFHSICFAFYDGSPVSITDCKGDIRLFNPTRDKLTHAVDNLESPDSSFLSCNVPLQGFAHPPCCSWIKSAWHGFEKFSNSHCCNLLLTH